MKKKSIVIKSVSLALAGIILLASCSSTTLIQSIPNGAKLYIDGEPVGTTPYRYSDTKIVGSTTEIRLEKEGYKETNVYFSRNEAVDVGAIIGGLFVWVPFLWIMKYKPAHTYELTPLLNNNQEINESIKTDAPSNFDKLRELKQLFDEGILTQEEYEQAKAKILNE